MPKFSAEMKEILVNGGQLDDQHIHLAQTLLQKQFSHLNGLQSTLLSETDGFAPVQQEGIQIHHVRETGHWVTSSSIGQSVAVYDSKFSGGDMSSSLTHQLALIYKLLVSTEDEYGDAIDPPILCVELPNVQQQNGVTDCGLFAIAFAVHLALGDDVAKLNFDQAEMRHHLQQCFQKKQMMPFLQSKNGNHNRYFPGREIELFCSCQMPETYDDMIECDTCEDWYHLKCVALAKFPRKNEQWSCKQCSE